MEENKSIVSGKKHTYSAKELMSVEFKEPNWAIKNVLPEGCAILAGNPKSGKSWLALNLCLSIAKGENALGIGDSESGLVHYLALEDIERRLQERLEKVLDGDEVPENLIFSDEWPKLNENGIEELDKWIQENKNVRLIVIDTLRMMGDSKGITASSSEYKQDYGNIGIYKNLAEKHKICILLVHHTRKDKDVEDTIETISGYFGLTGAVDTILMLNRKRNMADARLFITGRDVQEREYNLKFDARNCRWSENLENAGQNFIEEDVNKKGRSELDVLNAAFKAAERPMQPKELAYCIGKSHEATRQILSRYSRKELIAKIGDKYTHKEDSHSHSHENFEEQMNLPDQYDENRFLN